MTEYRVCFDFEADFTNGGGIQGQGFRLDIQGDEISDSDLAAYIVRDLRLLMVGELRILNKSIVEERHKRTLSPDRPALGQDAVHVDLSHVMANGSVTYKGLPALPVCDHLSHVQPRESCEDETRFRIGRTETVVKPGTCLDTPYHRFPGGDDLEALKLSDVSDLPGLVVRLRGHVNRAVDWAAFAAMDIAGKAVLVETGWSDHWGTERYLDDHPFLTADAARYLRDGGAALVGIDSLNIDDIRGGSCPVRTILLAAGIPIVEHLCNLSGLPNTEFRFSAVPPKIRRMGTFPVRAHATIGRAA